MEHRLADDPIQEFTYQLSQPQQGVLMLQKNTNSITLFPRHSSFNSRPLSEATEILDTDYEAEFSDIESPRRSIESLENDSATTLSTPDDLPTPDALDTSFKIGLGPSKPVQGPSGPHLFRSSLDASVAAKSDDNDWHFPSSPDELDDVRNSSILLNERIFDARLDARPPVEEFRPASSLSVSRASPHQDVTDVRAWTPAQVAEWMYEAGLEDMVVERFIENDISGAVLLDLQIEDLKELDIQSFGKRHGLMNMIQKLRSGTSARSIERSSSRLSRSSSMRRGDNRDHTIRSPVSDRGSSRQRRNRVISEKDIISPGESVSIVAIEQLIPKPHKCSKGENCPKYQRRQRKIARFAKEFPNEFTRISGEHISVPLASPAKTEHGLRPKSDATPSLVASSDVLGPSQLPELKLSAENLNGVQPRDPQENVRQFLNFQHMHNPVQPEYNQPPLEMFPPLSPPASSTPPANMTTQLRSLPRLVIPRSSSANNTFSPDRTITPSMGLPHMGSATATQETNPFHFGQDVYRHVTPFSEMDAPITAMPIEPLDRDASQSVPPNMRYGTLHSPTGDSIYRSQSVRPDHHRRRPSFTTMAPLTEGRVLPPIDNPSELRPALPAKRHTQGLLASKSATESGGTPTSSSKDNEVAHSGWMKKRKTRLLRHEWQDAHFTLKGTVLAMHKDERDSRSLETIDVDDYAVACSSLASNSKLTAAFKRSALRKAASLSQNGYRGMDETAFAFSLVPASGEKKSLFLGSGKSHHFAVKTRDDRINWMRELMLAKALKKGKEGGNEICVNGNVI
ncbi:SAM and PH domain-containing protein [Coccidioides immitis RS]|uniref:SAM and PH domain-containing protein n=1 Tax=Coccidioides immitis (strain RS) TaxID=246410 RepID=J3K4F4_COCIM|nr:SAM and PH domain-containing protein [Coccidioides immitis RS]EAS29182.3 SAM and PH domain-containing protein [Coccidioides immitis RS]